MRMEARARIGMRTVARARMRTTGACCFRVKFEGSVARYGTCGRLVFLFQNFAPLLLKLPHVILKLRIFLGLSRNIDRQYG